jgi:hypothetical protein
MRPVNILTILSLGQSKVREKYSGTAMQGKEGVVLTMVIAAAVDSKESQCEFFTILRCPAYFDEVTRAPLVPEFLHHLFQILFPIIN